MAVIAGLGVIIAVLMGTLTARLTVAAEEQINPTTKHIEPESGKPIEELQSEFLKLKFGMFIHFNIEEQIEFQKTHIAELVELYPDVFYLWNDGLDPEIMPDDKALTFIRGLRPGIIASANWWDWDKKGQPYLDLAVTETRHFPNGNKTPGETCWCLEQSWFWNDTFQPKTAQDIVLQLTVANARNANFLLNVAPDKEGHFTKSSVKVLAEIGKLRGMTVTRDRVKEAN
ncbi:alpha-L-fucosidase [candidate division KSB1 bacterium]|nr:alpha-L-fucosidase [candidate division KSB1 bacterium]